MKSVTSIRGQPYRQTPHDKDHNLAESLRNEGNLLFNVGRLFEALENFNRSLCAAELSSDDIPLAYGDRSAVYFEAKDYQLCLDNIQLAYDSGYPVDKIEKLRNREDDCNRILETHVMNPDDENPWNFFKLSYPPNERIPFIVDCVELRKSDNFGRFVITTQGQANDFTIGTQSVDNNFLTHRFESR